MPIRRGVVEAEKGSKGASFAKTQYWKIDEDGGIDIVRFLIDANPLNPDTGAPEEDRLPNGAPNPAACGGWMLTDRHAMVKCKPKPEGIKAEAGWPQEMSATCRHDPFFDGKFPDCAICTGNSPLGNNPKAKGFTPKPRTWSLAVRREEYELADGSGRRGIRDRTRKEAVPVGEPDKDGKRSVEEVDVKDIVVICQGYRNFWGNLESYNAVNHTLLDRDFRIRRKGMGMDNTSYTFMEVQPLVMADGSPFDLRRPDLITRYFEGGHREAEAYLLAVIEEQGSDEFFAKFFDTRIAWVPKEDGTSTTTPAPAGPDVPKADNDVEADRLTKLAARVRPAASTEGNGTPAPAEAAQQAPEAAPAAPQQAPADDEPQPAPAGSFAAVE